MKKITDKIKKPLLFIILGGLIVGYFFYLTNRNNDNSDNMAEQTPLSQVLSRDLELNYPGTPRGVVIYYSDILKVLYTLDGKKDHSDIENMAYKLRGLFDDELLERNPEETYITNLINEVTDYNSRKKTVADYIVEGNSNIEFITDNGKEYAKIDTAYFVHEDKNVVKTIECFTLRKDSDGKWKILYWQLGSSNDMEG